MIATLNNAAAKLGEILVDKHGLNRFGGHSLRTGGAYWLAENGMELLKIELLGRWKSALVVHYAGLAPIKNLGGDLDKAKQHSTLRQTIEEMATSLSKVEERMSQLDANTK
eukprot:1483350-Amphidinium_carterae.1